jgi:hypothetical protein
VQARFFFSLTQENGKTLSSNTRKVTKGRIKLNFKQPSPLNQILVLHDYIYKFINYNENISCYSKSQSYIFIAPLQPNHSRNVGTIVPLGNCARFFKIRRSCPQNGSCFLHNSLTNHYHQFSFFVNITIK